MRTLPSKLVMTALLFAVVPSAFAKTRPHSKTHATVNMSSSSRLHKSLHTAHSTAGIPSERATEIQLALIKQGYLTGEPSGAWDAQTSAAMSKLQGDNGWQTKITPDARGLIKLGLGPQSPAADQVVVAAK